MLSVPKDFVDERVNERLCREAQFRKVEHDLSAGVQGFLDNKLPHPGGLFHILFKVRDPYHLQAFDIGNVFDEIKVRDCRLPPCLLGKASAGGQHGIKVTNCVTSQLEQRECSRPASSIR